MDLVLKNERLVERTVLKWGVCVSNRKQARIDILVFLHTDIVIEMNKILRIWSRFLRVLGLWFVDGLGDFTDT